MIFKIFVSESWFFFFKLVGSTGGIFLTHGVN
jgi:hypothetical protein